MSGLTSIHFNQYAVTSRFNFSQMKLFQILFLVFLSTNAAAQDFNQTALNSVIQQIVMGSGPVSRSEYDKFWQQFGITKAEDKAQLIDAMKQRFVLAQEYQREIWLCAEQAWNSRSVPPCIKAQNKLSLLRTEMKKSDSESMLSPMSDYSDKLLNAAANRTSIQNSNGTGEVPVTLEMIKSTRDGLDKMLVRLGQVLRPNY